MINWLTTMQKIILVEDSLMLRERLGAMINAIPNALLVAETDNQNDAQCYLKQYQPDIAIIDLRLKQGSGFSLIEHIKTAYSNITIIVLTNLIQPEYREKCLTLGAHRFIDKTMDSKAFATLLTELCSHRTGSADSHEGSTS